MLIYVILNEVEDLVPASPDEMLHCVQHDIREICELNYDAVYSHTKTFLSVPSVLSVVNSQRFSITLKAILYNGKPIFDLYAARQLEQ